MPHRSKQTTAHRAQTRAQTFAQKAIARAASLPYVEVGQVVDVSPDVVLSHDNTAAIRQIWLQFGQQRVQNPKKLAITLDHAVPAPTTLHAQNHAEIRAFVREQGIQHFFEAGRGICHQVHSEEAIILPGQMILGADSHTPHFGWMGAFGAGIGRSEVAVLWATDELWLRVPESIRIVLNGRFPQGVTAKDFALRLIGDLGADGGLYTSIEFSGSTIENMSLEARMTLPNMMAELGAKTAYIAADDRTFDYLARRLYLRQQREEGNFASVDGPIGREKIAHLCTEIADGALTPDAEAEYLSTFTYDAASLQPYVACPHTVDNVVPLSDIAGTRVHQAFIGTCTNGRLEDIAAAAKVVENRQIAIGTRLIVIPASSQILQEATALGYIQTLHAAGAMIGVPGCGPCMGNHMGVPAPNEVTISSANRNFRGRMGTRESEIYLANPAVVAASAILGVIADPHTL